MRIWTSPEFSGLFPEGAPLRVLPGGQIRDAFLRDALDGDMAVLRLDAGYMDFLSALRARGASGPVIFISTGPAAKPEGVAAYNTIILDEGGLGQEGLGDLLDFIYRVAEGRAAGGFEGIPLSGLHLKKPTDERPAEGPLDVRRVLSHSMMKGLPVVVAFQITKEGEPFTARGICEVKDIGPDALVLHRFRPPALLKKLKFEPTADVHGVGSPGGGGPQQLRLHRQMFSVFAYEGDTYEALLRVVEADDTELHASIPERLVRERRRHVRVEPDPQEPVDIYMHTDGKPTARLRVTDISQQGAGFVSSGDLRVGDAYSFTIVLPEPKALVQSHGVVRFKRKAGDVFRYGVELRVHPWDERLLARYIMKRESEILNMLRKP